MDDAILIALFVFYALGLFTPQIARFFLQQAGYIKQEKNNDGKAKGKKKKSILERLFSK